MIGLLWNLILALIWVAVTADFSLSNLIVGFALGFLILYFARRIIGAPAYADRAWRAARFGLFFLWEVFLANLRVASDVLTPSFRTRPAILAIPLDAKTDAEITLLANLITLTPGTLSLDISADRRILYIHTMFLEQGDVERTKRKIKEQMERGLLEVLR
jgi:multicomponent Na+:H+ antiporter subunit E